MEHETKEHIMEKKGKKMVKKPMVSEKRMMIKPKEMDRIIGQNKQSVYRS